MDNTKHDFLNSLDLTDEEMEMFIPYVLQDLWELGSIPEYIFSLINSNLETKDIGSIIDLGCGKGAVLVYLADRFDIHGLGVDIVPQFIDSANKYAHEYSVNDRLRFIVGDLTQFLDGKEKYDIVIYGYDSAILGDVSATISRLRNCLDDSGHIILEIAFTPDSKPGIEGLPTEKELMEHFSRTGMNIIDRIFWDTGMIKTINDRNNRLISSRIQELIIHYPDKANMFNRYMYNQIAECKSIENDMICSTWVLGGGVNKFSPVSKSL